MQWYLNIVCLLLPRLLCVAFSTANAVVNDANCTVQSVLNSMSGDDNIEILPGLYIYGVAAGTVVDFTYSICARDKSNTAFLGQLMKIVNATPVPQVYGPQYTFTGELASIVMNIKKNVGSRTNHLAQLVT